MTINFPKEICLKFVDNYFIIHTCFDTLKRFIFETQNELIHQIIVNRMSLLNQGNFLQGFYQTG